MNKSKEIPSGFVRHDRRSGLTDPWEPIYASSTTTGLVLGIYADQAHVNSRGFVHGGLLSALADNAMGLSCARQMDNVGGLVTISLSIDYLGTAHIGEWIEVRATPTRLGKSVCFSEARIFSNEKICATAKAIFKVL